MKKYILTLAAFSIIIFNQQALQANSETVREMDKGAASGEEAAGPVGAAVGGLFGSAVGLVKDTGNTISGKTEAEIELKDQRDDETNTLMYDEDTDDGLYVNEPQSNTANEMEKAAASGEEIAGPVGAAIGGLFGTGVGLVEDTGELITGETYEEDEILDQQEEIPSSVHVEMREDGNLTVEEVE